MLKKLDGPSRLSVWIVIMIAIHFNFDWNSMNI